jgi:hypothetical protein
MVDFSVPEPRLPLSQAEPPPASTVLLPIAFIRKRRMGIFHLIDEQDRRCPVLTHFVRVSIAQHALVALANGLLETTLHPDVRNELCVLPAEPVHVAYPTLRHFIAAWQLKERDPLLTDERVRQRRLLFQHEPFRIVAYTLTWSYVLLAQVSNQVGTRHTMTFAYTERALIRPLHESTVRDEVAKERDSRFIDRLRRLRWHVTQLVRNGCRELGWSSRRFWLPCPSVAYGSNYHIEIEAPPGTQITVGALYCETRLSPRRDPYKVRHNEVSKLRRRRGADDIEHGSLSKLHLYVWKTPNTAIGLVEVELHARRETFVQSAALTALLATALLGAGLHFRPRLEVDAGTTLLLLLPSILAVYVVQPGEHAMAARLVRSVRGFAVVSGLAMIVATGSLIVAHGKPASETAWIGATVAAGIASVVLIGAWIQARRRRYRSSGRGHEPRA